MTFNPRMREIIPKRPYWNAMVCMFTVQCCEVNNTMQNLSRDNGNKIETRDNGNKIETREKNPGNMR